MTMQETILQLAVCKSSKCKKDSNSKTITNEYLKKFRNIYDNYINKTITHKELYKQINDLHDTYYKEIDIIAISKCELDKCSKFIKKKLDYLASKIGYTIKNYTFEDYIKIIKYSAKISPDNPFDLIICKDTYCAKEIENNRLNSSKYLKSLNKYYDDYINNKINKIEFQNKIDKLVKDYYNSNQAKTLFQCELDKCYSIIKKKLDYMAIYIHYDIKDKYTLNDYINILTISEKIHDNFK